MPLQVVVAKSKFLLFTLPESPLEHCSTTLDDRKEEDHVGNSI